MSRIEYDLLRERHPEFKLPIFERFTNFDRLKLMEIDCEDLTIRMAERLLSGTVVKTRDGRYNKLPFNCGPE